MNPAPRVSRPTDPRLDVRGHGCLVLLTLGLALSVAPGCASGNLPKPIPDSARRRVTQGEAFLQRSSPLADSTRLEDSAAVRNWEGRAPVPPHWSPGFRAQAGAHQDQRYVHSLTARANAQRSLPSIPASELEPVAAATAPVEPEPPRATPPEVTGFVSSPRRPPALPTYARPAAPPLRRPAQPTTYRPPSKWTPPRTTQPATPPPLTIPASITVSTGSTFSMSSVPAHLQDLAALNARESQLADRSIELGLERRAVLRVAKAIREHRSQGSTTSRRALDDAFREYRSTATASAGLSIDAGERAFESAEPAVRDRLTKVRDDRKAVLRLIGALQGYRSNPSATNGEALADAVAKYQGR